MTPSLRVPADDDAAEVARLMSEGWPEPFDVELVHQAWSAPGFDRGRDARLSSIGYAHVDAIDASRTWISLRGQPSPELVDWAEERACERGGRILSSAWSRQETVLDELRSRGFSSIRHSFRMSVGLETPPSEPALPEGVLIRTYRDGDAPTFYDMDNEAFVDTWEPADVSYDEWTHWLLDTPSFDPDLWFIAEAGEEAAGFAICKVQPGEVELGKVQILGVRRPWRGRGIGRALLLTAFGAFRERGIPRAGLGVDADNPTGATRLYESVGMRVTDQFEIFEKLPT